MRAGNDKKSGMIRMLLISIVDDTPKDATALKRCVEEYCKRNGLTPIIRVFRGGMDFFNSVYITMTSFSSMFR